MTNGEVQGMGVGENQMLCLQGRMGHQMGWLFCGRDGDMGWRIFWKPLGAGVYPSYVQIWHFCRDMDNRPPDMSSAPYP